MEVRVRGTDGQCGNAPLCYPLFLSVPPSSTANFRHRAWCLPNPGVCLQATMNGQDGRVVGGQVVGYFGRGPCCMLSFAVLALRSMRIPAHRQMAECVGLEGRGRGGGKSRTEQNRQRRANQHSAERDSAGQSRASFDRIRHSQ
jgi:hypothetical protein